MLPLDRPAYIILPPPISTNSLFRNVEKVGRVKTGKYKAWITEAEQRLAAQRPLPQFACPVSLTIFIGEKGVGDMDSDNAAKACIDALVRSKVIHDDSKKYVRGQRTIWVPKLRGCVVEVRPAPAPPAIEEILSRIKSGLHELLK